MRVVHCIFAVVATVSLGCGSDELGTEVPVAEEIAGDVSEGDIGSATFALTWAGESIEQNNEGQFHTFPYMYTIDNPTSNVCGWTGNPGDYILYFNRPGAYANRANLRLDGQTVAARCMIKNPSSARVYDNDRVWVCVGSGRVAACPGGVSSFSGIGLWGL